jgi:membrane protein DedA with SNARE-associated domain
MNGFEPAALFAIVGLILVKEAGVPIPVPGDLIVIGAGVAAGRGDLDPVVALLAIVLASIAGGIVQYGLLRSVARPALLRLLRRLGSAERVDRQTERLRRGGARSVAVARSTPGVRIVAVAASALAGIPAIAFVTGLTVGNGLFIGAHFGLGYVIGEPVVNAVRGALGPLAIGAVALAVLGGIGWFTVRRRRGGTGPTLPDVTAWADACCPACLALAVVETGSASRGALPTPS